jgi:hypothetical protein
VIIYLTYEDESRLPTAPLSWLLRTELHVPDAALVHAAREMLKVPGLELVQDKPSKKFEALLRDIIYDAKL